jgi:hypothetical protein
MTAAGPPGQPPPGDLAARVFRALYPGYELHALGGTWLACPRAPRGSPPRPSARSPGRSPSASTTRRSRPASCPVPVTPRSAEAAR